MNRDSHMGREENGVGLKGKIYPSRAMLVMLSVVVGLLSLEIALRIVGYPVARDIDDYMPNVLLRDDELGWRHNPGKYFFQAEGARPIKVTYWPNGLRATRELPAHDGKEVILLGCSFVDGFGLSDEDTFAWKLQVHLPDLSVQNLGTAGYGTYQSLLALRRYLTQSTSIAPVIVYGFADFHTARNIKNALGQRYWRSPAIFPYCDDEHCTSWPGSPQSSGLKAFLRTAALLDAVKDAIALRGKVELSHRVTARLLKEMAETARGRGARLIVAPVFLQDPFWEEELKTLDLEVVRCDKPELSRPEFLLSDGHPNARWSEEFSRCLGGFLRSGTGEGDRTTD